MAEDFHDRPSVGPLLVQQRGTGVPKIVETHLTDAGAPTQGRADSPGGGQRERRYLRALPVGWAVRVIARRGQRAMALTVTVHPAAKGARVPAIKTGDSSAALAAIGFRNLGRCGFRKLGHAAQATGPGATPLCRVHRRRGRLGRLRRRRVFHLSAPNSIIREGPSRDCYLKKRGEGCKHVQAVIPLAHRRLNGTGHCSGTEGGGALTGGRSRPVARLRQATRPSSASLCIPVHSAQTMKMLTATSTRAHRG